MSHSQVCLIGPGAPSSNPRLVKEACALAEAGYRVRVVCGASHSLGAEMDAPFLASPAWSTCQLEQIAKWRRVPRVVRSRLSATFAWRNWSARPGFAAWAESESTGQLVAAASSERADLYIGHYLPGLYAARQAAQRHGTTHGFDIEDSHVDELPDTPVYAGRRLARESLERELLRGCRHVTSSSPLISDQYRRRYGVEPTQLLNVFPLKDAPSEPLPTSYESGSGPASLYWFSQTIGSGRGLEEIVRAMGVMRVPVSLHLRGKVSSAYRESLERLAISSGVPGRVVFLPPAAGDEMARLAAPHDLGLALELCEPPNRAICLTNKAFTYLLGGVPVLLSRTPAQEWLSAQLGSAGMLADLSDPTGTATLLDTVLSDRATLGARRRAAWKASHDQFNWECESQSLVRSVRAVIGPP